MRQNPDMSGTEGFEELDLGRRSRATLPSGRPGPPLPPLSLDASANESSGPAADQPPSGPVTAPPGDLSDPSDPTKPSRPRGAPASPWQQWAGLGAALAIGATVGIVGANARDDAADGAAVALVAGTLTAQSPIGFRDFELQRLSLPLFNAGPRAVEVESIELPGWRRQEDVEGLEPITIEPQEWQTITVVLLPDCDVRPRPSVTVTARSESETKTVELPFPTGDQSRVYAWESACSPQAPYGEIQGSLVDVVESDATHLVVTVSMQHFGDHQLEVLDLWSTTSGLTATTPVLPITLPPEAPALVRLELHVTDCVAAAGFTDLALYADVDSVDGSLAQTQIPVFVGDNRLLIEAARFSDDACE